MDGIIADFCDGDVCANHPLFSSDPKAIQIFLYYDDVAVVNPLGSKTSKHKFGKSNQLYFKKKNTLFTHQIVGRLACFTSYFHSSYVTNRIVLCLFVCKEISSVKSS